MKDRKKLWERIGGWTVRALMLFFTLFDPSSARPCEAVLHLYPHVFGKSAGHVSGRMHHRESTLRVEYNETCLTA